MLLEDVPGTTLCSRAGFLCKLNALSSYFPQYFCSTQCPLVAPLPEKSLHWNQFLSCSVKHPISQFSGKGPLNSLLWLPHASVSLFPHCPLSRHPSHLTQFLQSCPSGCAFDSNWNITKYTVSCVLGILTLSLPTESSLRLTSKLQIRTCVCTCTTSHLCLYQDLLEIYKADLGKQCEDV